jgi:hypothetical protein
MSICSSSQAQKHCHLVVDRLDLRNIYAVAAAVAVRMSSFAAAAAGHRSLIGGPRLTSPMLTGSGNSY